MIKNTAAKYQPGLKIKSIFRSEEAQNRSMKYEKHFSFEKCFSYFCFALRRRISGTGGLEDMVKCVLHDLSVPFVSQA